MATFSIYRDEEIISTFDSSIAAMKALKEMARDLNVKMQRVDLGKNVRKCLDFSTGSEHPVDPTTWEFYFEYQGCKYTVYQDCESEDGWF